MQFACDNIVSSSELSLLHLGPVQIPRFTQNLELRPIEVQKSWVSVLRLVRVSVRVAVRMAPGLYMKVHQSQVFAILKLVPTNLQ